MANTGLNRLYLAEGVDYSQNCYETKRNLNTLVVGASGCGKTRSIVTPNLLSCSGSYVISDPKGNLYGKYAKFLQQNGYKVRLVDLVHLDRGEGFNFMDGLANEEDIMSAAVVFQQSHTDNTRVKMDPFWDHSEIQALSGAIGCVLETNKLLECTPNAIPEDFTYGELTNFRLSEMILKQVILKKGNRYTKTVRGMNNVYDDLYKELYADRDNRKDCIRHYMKQLPESGYSYQAYRREPDLMKSHLLQDLEELRRDILNDLAEADSIGSVLCAVDRLYNQVVITAAMQESQEMQNELRAFLRGFAKSVQDMLERILSHDLFTQYELLRAARHDCYGIRQLERIRNMSCEKTVGNIMITTQAPLALIDTAEVNRMMERAEQVPFDFAGIGTEKTALFVCVSDSDRKMDSFANLLFSRVLQELCAYADTQCRDNALPVHLTLIMDDFATNVKLRDIPRSIASFRSRNISVLLIVQSEGQLEQYYGPDAQTIIANCDQYLFAGSQSLKDAETISRKINKPIEDILYMSIGECIVFRRGDRPRFAKLIDHDRFLKSVGFTQEPTREVKETAAHDMAV